MQQSSLQQRWQGTLPRRQQQWKGAQQEEGRKHSKNSQKTKSPKNKFKALKVVQDVPVCKMTADDRESLWRQEGWRGGRGLTRCATSHNPDCNSAEKNQKQAKSGGGVTARE